MAFIAVRHNIEVAHRLYETKGKCEQIHGHSMWVELRIHGLVDKHGILDGLEFGDVKRKFRSYLDDEFDHRLLLNSMDPWAGPVRLDRSPLVKDDHLPGLRVFEGDPTTENIAKWVAEWGARTFKLACDCYVQETSSNAAGASAKFGG